MPVKLKCKFCKKTYFVKPHRKSESSFCSRKCKWEFQKTSMLGKGNNMYGISLLNPRKNKTLEEYHGIEEAKAIKKRVSEGTKLGMSKKEARKNFINGILKRKMPEGHFHRLGVMCKGRKHSFATRKKMSEHHIGKILSISARKKMGEAIRLRWKEGRYDHIDFSKIWLGRKHKPETIKKMRRSRIKYMIKHKSRRSKIERVFFKELKERIPNIKTQFNFFDLFVVDAAIPIEKIVIEFYGNYWHANPDKYPKPTNKQISYIIRDHYRRDKILSHGWKLIRVWEYNYMYFPNITLLKTEQRKEYGRINYP